MYITVESNIDVNDKSTITDFNVINNHTSTANESTSLGGTTHAEIGGTEGSLLGGTSSPKIKSSCNTSKTYTRSNQNELCTLSNEMHSTNSSRIVITKKCVVEDEITNGIRRVPPEPPPKIYN